MSGGPALAGYVDVDRVTLGGTGDTNTKTITANEAPIYEVTVKVDGDSVHVAPDTTAVDVNDYLLEDGDNFTWDFVKPSSINFTVLADGGDTVTIYYEVRDAD